MFKLSRGWWANNQNARRHAHWLVTELHFVCICDQVVGVLHVVGSSRSSIQMGCLFHPRKRQMITKFVRSKKRLPDLFWVHDSFSTQGDLCFVCDRTSIEETSWAVVILRASLYAISRDVQTVNQSNVTKLQPYSLNTDVNSYWLSKLREIYGLFALRRILF